MIDYPEDITPIGIFQERYCYNDSPSDQSFYYSGPQSQYQPGYEGSRRNDIEYKPDMYNGITENPFDRNRNYNNYDTSNPWAQPDSRQYSYQDQRPNEYFERTHTDRPMDFGGSFSRRQDTLPIDSMRDGYGMNNGYGYSSQQYGSRDESYPGSGYGSYDSKPQDIMPNGYSYNNPYASALGMEVVGFDRRTSENWRNQYVEERPIRSQLNPWRDTYDQPYDNRYQAFQNSLQPTIPTSSSSDDQFASWDGYAERNWPSNK